MYYFKNSKGTVNIKSKGEEILYFHSYILDIIKDENREYKKSKKDNVIDYRYNK